MENKIRKTGIALVVCGGTLALIGMFKNNGNFILWGTITGILGWVLSELTDKKLEESRDIQNQRDLNIRKKQLQRELKYLDKRDEIFKKQDEIQKIQKELDDMKKQDTEKFKY